MGSDEIMPEALCQQKANGPSSLPGCWQEAGGWRLLMRRKEQWD